MRIAVGRSTDSQPVCNGGGEPESFYRVGRRLAGSVFCAVEWSGSPGRGVAQFLAGRGEQAREVNPRWTAQRRRGLRRPGTSDVLDAQAGARLLREEGESLPLVQAQTVPTASLQL
jgi:hypothetical protein